MHPAGYKAFYSYNILDTVIEKREITVSETGSFDLPVGRDLSGNIIGTESQNEDIQSYFDSGKNITVNLRLVFLNIPVEETIYTTDLDISTNEIPEDSDGIDDTPIIIPYELLGREFAIDPRI